MDGGAEALSLNIFLSPSDTVYFFPDLFFPKSVIKI